MKVVSRFYALIRENMEMLERPKQRTRRMREAMRMSAVIEMANMKEMEVDKREAEQMSWLSGT